MAGYETLGESWPREHDSPNLTVIASELFSSESPAGSSLVTRCRPRALP